MSMTFVNNTGEECWWIAKQDDDSVIRYWTCESGTETTTGLDGITGYATEAEWFTALEALGIPCPPPDYPSLEN